MKVIIERMYKECKIYMKIIILYYFDVRCNSWFIHDKQRDKDKGAEMWAYAAQCQHT